MARGRDLRGSHQRLLFERKPRGRPKRLDVAKTQTRREAQWEGAVKGAGRGADGLGLMSSRRCRTPLARRRARALMASASIGGMSMRGLAKTAWKARGEALMASGEIGGMSRMRSARETA